MTWSDEVVRAWVRAVEVRVDGEVVAAIPASGPFELAVSGRLAPGDDDALVGARIAVGTEVAPARVERAASPAGPLWTAVARFGDRAREGLLRPALVLCGARQDLRVCLPVGGVAS